MIQSIILIRERELQLYKIIQNETKQNKTTTNNKKDHHNSPGKYLMTEKVQKLQ